MRAYLLGLLPNHEAAALEEEYFVNRAVFLKLQSEETALIADYLDGRLRTGEKQAFEKRYLQPPEMRSKVEEARRQRGARPHDARPPLWAGLRLGLAAAFVLVLALGLGLSIYRSRLREQPAAAIPPPVHGVLAILQLTPGLTKGAGSSTQIEQPAPGAAIVEMVLELPGQSSPVARTVRIFMVKPDGGLELVWRLMQPVRSSSNVFSPAAQGSLPEGQVLILPLPGSLFQPGDYVVQAWTVEGGVHETYVYRVTRRRPAS